MNKYRNVALLWVLFLSLCFISVGCGKKKQNTGPYAKEVTIVPPTQYESMFSRIIRSYKRANLDYLLDSLSRDCPSYSDIGDKMARVFRRGEKHSLILDRTLKKTGKSELTYEVRWRSSHFDIYEDQWKTYKGHCYVKVSCGAVPRIISISGSNPFLIKG